MHQRYGCTGLRIPLPGRRQVEVWFAPKGAEIPSHVHPCIVSRLKFLAGRMIWRRRNVAQEFSWRDLFTRWFVVPPDCEHGATVTGWFGLFLNFETWLPGADMTSAAVDLVETNFGNTNLESRKAGKCE